MLRNADHSQQGAPERTVRGIVVGRRSAGEGSARVFLYTDSLGLVSVLAKSVREERSKLRAHLVEGTCGVFTLVRGSSYWRVIGAVRCENAYFALGNRIVAKESAARVLGIVRQFVRGEGSDPYFFAALWDYLKALPTLPDGDVRLAECIVALKLLAALGYVGVNADIERFLDASYGEGTLAEAAKVRSQIVSAINEGIAASGL